MKIRIKQVADDTLGIQWAVESWSIWWPFCWIRKTYLATEDAAEAFAKALIASKSKGREIK
jgi:hypothetical protein